MKNDDWHMLDDDEPLNEEQEEALEKAYTQFIMNFMDYIHKVDPQLFKRAKEYAIDYSGNDRVQIVDRNKEGNE